MFKVENDASLRRIEDQTVKLPEKTDHMTSTVIKDDQTEYIVAVGGYCGKNVTVCSIGLDG